MKKPKMPRKKTPSPLTGGMAKSPLTGGIAQSPSRSGIIFQGDQQFHVMGSSNFGNPSSPLPGHMHANMDPISNDVSNTILNSLASSGPSVGASSLVTDANSGLSGGPHLQRSASINNESYMRLPASPLSFSSNNITISGSSAMDGSCIVQSPNQDLGSQPVQPSRQHQRASTATSLPRKGKAKVSGEPQARNYFQEPTNVSRLQKKPRLDAKQEDMARQHVVQQVFQRQDPVLHNPNPQMQALYNQQILRQQEHQLLKALPPAQRTQLLHQQQQLQLQGMPPVKLPYDGGVCSRRLMQYLYHQRQRPSDNAIGYWRNFVSEYYHERAKKRWCLSLYENVGSNSLGMFPQVAMDAWQCEICGSRSGRGFEATFEVLPRLIENEFSGGVIDELLYLDLPREVRFSSGVMMLEYAKAVQETVYEQLRVVREGHLRIFFSPDLRILSWEFCARRHEELLPRRLVASQVNQFLQVAQKCQSTISESGADGISQPDLQANSSLVAAAGSQLAKSLELQSLNNLGFSKTYVRFLQITDVVNSMKDLIDFCKADKKDPIDGLKNFAQLATARKTQMQTMQGINQFGSPQGCLPTDQSTLNKLMTMRHPLGGHVSLVGSPQSAFLTSTNHQNSLTRHNSTYNLIQAPGSSSAILLQAPQHHLTSGIGLIQQSQAQPLNGREAFQQQMIQQYLHDMSKRNNSGNILGGGFGFRNHPSTTLTGQGPRIAHMEPPSSSSNFKADCSSDEYPVPSSQVGVGQKASELPQNACTPQSVCTSDEMVPDIVSEIIEKGFFSDDIDLDDNMNFSWKA